MKFQNKSEDKTQNSLKKSENNDTTFIKRKYSNNEIKSVLLSTVISSIGEDTTDASSSNLNPSWNSSPVIGTLDFEPSTQTKKTSEVVEPFVKQTQTKREKNRHNVYFSKASYLVGPSMSQLPSINF